MHIVKGERVVIRTARRTRAAICDHCDISFIERENDFDDEFDDALADWSLCPRCDEEFWGEEILELEFDPAQLELDFDPAQDESR